MGPGGLRLKFEERFATSANARMALDGASEQERTAIRQAIAGAVQAHKEDDGVIRLRNEAICVAAW